MGLRRTGDISDPEPGVPLRLFPGSRAGHGQEPCCGTVRPKRAGAANGWELEIDLQTFSRSSVHDTIAAVTAASEGKDPLVGRTTLSHPDGSYECTLEYPIKTMNFRPETPSFQVDTGPLVLPDFSPSEESMIDRLVMAHVAFNRFDRAEFIIRLPTPIDESRPDGPRTLHYAEVREYPATNQILTGAY